MSNLVGGGNNISNSGAGGGGGAFIAIPLIVIASFSLKSGVSEGCGKQAVKNMDQIAPTRVERNPNHFLEPYTLASGSSDEKKYPFKFNQGKTWESPGSDHEEQIGDQLKDFTKDAVESILEPKDTSAKK